MTRPCKIDPDGNVTFSLAFRTSLALISLLVGLILSVFAFIGSKALASMEGQEKRISALELSDSRVNVKLDYIIKWIDRQQ